MSAELVDGIHVHLHLGRVAPQSRLAPVDVSHRRSHHLQPRAGINEVGVAGRGHLKGKWVSGCGVGGGLREAVDAALGRLEDEPLVCNLWDIDLNQPIEGGKYDLY